MQTMGMLEIELAARAQEDDEERRKKGQTHHAANPAVGAIPGRGQAKDKKGAGKGKNEGSAGDKPVCTDFMKDAGCPRGDKCAFRHPPRTGKCLRCGAIGHQLAQCRRPQRVDEAKYRWGLPVLVPTCPRKLFMLGPRLKYVDIVTDTLHASSSDLITWNTLVLLKLRWFTDIPRQWLAIATHSLEAWKARDQLSQLHNDNRRGYARVTPIALSHIGVPGSNILHADEYPTEGLGVYDDFEVCDSFSGYIWATWTTMAAQPMQIDSALQALLNPCGGPSGQSDVCYDPGVPINVNAADQPMGSNECASGVAAPFPDSVEDVSMESGVDKRSRESPDSTLRPEGKSLKTS